jgi:hypothetical protein
MTALKNGAPCVVIIDGAFYRGRVHGLRVDGQGREWVGFRPLFGWGEWVRAEQVALTCGCCGDCTTLNQRSGQCEEWIGPGAVAAALGL